MAGNKEYNKKMLKEEGDYGMCENMTDSEKLNIILFKVISLEGDMQGVHTEIKGMQGEIKGMKAEMKGMQGEIKTIKKDVSALKRKLTRSTDDLKRMDELILNEVEKVHAILDKHIGDKKVHLA